MNKINTGYSLNECPPMKELFLYSIQQIIVAVFNVIPVPLLIGAGIGLSQSEITILVAGCLLVTGIATILQTIGVGAIGAKLPIVLECSVVFVAPAISLGSKYGLNVYTGACLIGSIITIILWTLFHKILTNLFKPYITGSVVMVLGISLFSTGITYCAGGSGTADFGGGIPWIEYSKENEQEHVKQMCDLAKKYDKGISMLLDDVGDAEERTLEMLAKKVIEMGWQKRVTAQHCRVMALYPENYFRKLIQLVKEAGIGFVTDPHTGPLHLQVKDLLEAGIPVALGQDDIADAYYPYGECNMLQVAFLASHLLWMTTFEDMEKLYDMITIHAGKVLGLQNHILKKGGDADLVILQDHDVYHAIWHHKAPLVVIKDGKIIQKNQ